MFVASLDLGTTGCRTFIFDIAGTIVAWDYQEWQSMYPKPSYVEQDANAWWDAIKATIEAAIKKSGVDRTEIISLSITNQRETIVPVDSQGNPLHNALVWQDRRTKDQVEFIKEKVGEEKIYKTTGLTIDPYFSATKILWFKDEKPEIYNKTHKFLLVSDFILNKLTGKFVSDFSNLSRTMLFDINNLRYSEDIASELEIDLDKMPDPIESGVDIGEIVTDETDFDKKTLVVTGAGDQQAAALGVGIVSPGEIKCTTGTGSFILAYQDEPKFDPERRVLCSCHALPGAWVQEASIFTTGSVLRWFRDQMGYVEIKEAEEKGVDPYDLMTAKAEESSVGANGLLLIPHLVGAGAPHWNPYSKGILFGLSLGHEKKDVYRAILEGVAYEVRKNIEIFKKLGIEPVELRLTGGGSRSDLWCQIFASVLNINCIRNVNEEATSLGSAILAAAGAGVFQDITKAAKEVCEVDKKWLPNSKHHEYYNQMYEFSKDLYNILTKNKFYKIFEDISEFDVDESK
ncbi:MAG: Glycerol kinase [Promethearchaeota archaeon]|nr:MAG: Glycerol kinase [Candidatus Lokiarchaeota archaeon]